jgi:hypothetical protein
MSDYPLQQDPASPQDNTCYEYVAEVQQRYTEYLMHKRYVVGVSIGMADSSEIVVHYCLVVLVTVLMTPEDLDPDDRIPDDLDGVPVMVQEIGEISAQSFDAGG